MNNIYITSENKFKSILVSINYLVDVKKEEISYFSVLSSILGKSCKKYSSQKMIEKHLLKLYGAVFDINVQKVGDLYNIEFRIEFVNKKFLPNNVDLFERCLKFLNEIIYNPVMDNNRFTGDIIEREKNVILDRVLQRKDDKIYYGMVKADEAIFENEVAGAYVYGDENIIPNITNEDLIYAYNRLLNDSSIQVLVTGNLEGYDNIHEGFKKIFGDKLFGKYNIKNFKVNKNDNMQEKKNVRETLEEIDSTQSILSFAFRVINPKLEDYYSLTVYNAILGGTPSSKLFQNFREKESLAYVVTSRYYRFKNVVIISSAISRKNYEKAKQVILKQVEDIKNGKITTQEFEAAKQSILSNMIEWMDSKLYISKLYYSNLASFKRDDVTIEDMYNKFKSLTLDDIVTVSNKVKLEEIVMLGGKMDV